ncbi:MAG: response regulator [Planctomycetota bacterium]
MNYRKTILHVDDDPQLTRLVAHYLQPLGYEVTSLNDPTQTLRVLSELQHRLVLLDIDMPEANGLDLLQQIKHTHGGSQVIMLTGLVSTQTLLQSYRWGAEFCIFKPMTNVAPLLEAVEAVFRKIDHWWSALEELGKQRRNLENGGGLPLPEAALEVPISQLVATTGLQEG